MEHSTLRESVRDSAAGWHDRLHRDKVAAETRAAFARWLAESPENRVAYEEIERAWSTLKGVAHEPEILALRHETALRLTRTASHRTRALRWSLAAGIVLLVGVGAAMLSIRASHPGFAPTALLDLLRGDSYGRYVTATGERLTVTLKDGSQLTLNTQTELTVAFSDTERTVRLARGQAIFEVAKEPARPFVVEAQNRRVVAVGTAFDVRVDRDRINVTMIEGTVRVEPVRSSSKADPVQDGSPSRATPRAVVAMLSAGEQLTVDSASEAHIQPMDAERVTSWRRGQVIFENTRLADAIEELNRYSETRIELADPALADLRLSGGFATGRPQGFVEAITAYFPIRIEHSDEHVVVLGARTGKRSSAF